MCGIQLLLLIILFEIKNLSPLKPFGVIDTGEIYQHIPFAINLLFIPEQLVQLPLLVLLLQIMFFLMPLLLPLLLLMMLLLLLLLLLLVELLVFL